MLKRADEFIIYDSTAHHRGCRVFAQFNSGNLCKTASAMPEWVAKVSGNCRTFVRNHAQSIVAWQRAVGGSNHSSGRKRLRKPSSG